MPETTEERLAAVERRVDAMGKKSKDFWDVFQIVATLLIPASIALAGYWFSDAEKKAEVETTRMQVKVGQAQLISTFMESLLSDKPQRQKLAIEGVLVALPEEGPKLVQILSLDQSSPGVQQAAITSLDERRASLIKDCFSNDKSIRISATTELVQGWQTDRKLVQQLIDFAQKNSGNASGVINALVVLENVSSASLATNADLVRQFAQSVKGNGPQTAEHVAAVEARLDSVPAH